MQKRTTKPENESITNRESERTDGGRIRSSVVTRRAPLRERLVPAMEIGLRASHAYPRVGVPLLADDAHTSLTGVIVGAPGT